MSNDLKCPPVNFYLLTMFDELCKKGKGKGSPYSIAERRVPEQLIPVVHSQSAGDLCHKPRGRLPLLSVRPAVTLATQPLRGLLPISLLGEQRHDGYEQFAQDCYLTASRLRFEPRPSAAESSMLTTRLPSHKKAKSVEIQKIQVRQSYTKSSDKLVRQLQACRSNSLKLIKIKSL